MRTTRDFVIYAQPYIRGRVLDAGGGPAAKYKSLLEQHAQEYLCMDSQSGGKVDVVGDVASMPFEDASFDTVVCNQVLEHVERPDRVLAESFRVLRSGGYFLCTAPFLEPIHSDPGDFFRYTSDGLRSMCQSAGFMVEQSGKYGGLGTVLFSFIKFSVFDPYKNPGRWARRLTACFDWIAKLFDGQHVPGRIYSDAYIIARKP